MSVEAALYTHLVNHPGLNALVGTRIYPGAAPPDSTDPHIVYTLISDTAEVSHDGPSGLGRVRYQFDCWAGTTPSGVPDQDTAAAIATQLRLALHNAQASHGTDTCRGFLPAGRRDMPDPLTARGRRIADFTFWHEEETP